MKYKKLIALIVPLLSSMAVAEPSFSVQDENGKISRDEWYGSVDDAGIFSDWDSNQDKRIDENEYAVWTTTMTSAIGI